MLKKQFKFLKIAIIFSFYVGTASAEALFPKACDITPGSIAKIRLGTSLNQIKAIYPKVKLARVTDGDGVALVSVTVGNRSNDAAFGGAV